MKHRNILLALVAFLAGIGVAMVVPALAQQGGNNTAWEVMVAPYGTVNLGVVKHNSATGQTLVLTCGNECGKKDAWLELPVKASD